MAQIEIPALGRKFNLLIRYGDFKDLSDLATAFDRKASTLQWWCHGDEVRSRDAIPSTAFEKFVSILVQCLPEAMTADEINALIAAPASEFEAALAIGAQDSLNRLIETQAQTVFAKLILKNRPKTGLIETDENERDRAPLLSTSLGNWFRLEFISWKFSGYVWALQHVAQSWGVVGASIDPKTGNISLPSRGKDGSPSHMIERHQSGIHRFIVMQTDAPPPQDYYRYMREKIELDAAILGRFAHYFTQQPERSRQLHLLEVEIKATTGSTA